MGQVGVRAESPLTLLREYVGALRALLAGDEVSTQGRSFVSTGCAWAARCPAGSACTSGRRVPDPCACRERSRTARS